jgi:hypothetical protein
MPSGVWTVWRSFTQSSNSDLNNLLELRTMIKQFRPVSLPDEIDLNGCSLAIKLILFGESHHSGPIAFFAGITDHFEFGPIAFRPHPAHEDFRNFPFEPVKRQAPLLNVLPPLMGTEHAVSWLDSKILRSSRCSLNLINKALVFLELVNDSHRVPHNIKLAEVIKHDSQIGEQPRSFQ